jgi:squalene-hopene/tetraprenyl-beta-curcumene cyclase
MQVAIQESPAERNASSAPISTEQLDRAIHLARENLLGLQLEDGHWRGELEADSVLESEYILLLHFLGRTEEERVQKMARRIRASGVCSCPMEAGRSTTAGRRR